MDDMDCLALLAHHNCDLLVVLHDLAIKPHVSDACQTHAEQALLTNAVLLRFKFLATEHDHLPIRESRYVDTAPCA
jgi:hypothetical protein